MQRYFILFDDMFCIYNNIDYNTNIYFCINYCTPMDPKLVKVSDASPRTMNDSGALNLPTPQLWAYKDNTIKSNTFKGLSIPASILLINIALLLGFIWFWRVKINQYAINKDIEHASLVNKYKSSIIAGDEFLWYPWINKLISDVSGPVTQITLDTIMTSTIPFIFKRDIIEEKVALLLSELVKNSETLTKVQEDSIKYWFLHQDIMALLNPEEEAIPVIDLLHTIETVKFSTALKIFSLLDTFLSKNSSKFNIDKSVLSDTMIAYTKRWEKDVDRFLDVCYLNPYESLPDCDKIGDFNNYFIYNEKNSTLDPSLFSKILFIIGNSIEQSDLPSLQIVFDNFSPRAKVLWFNVTVNTLPEDEAGFISKGIINPHIFIISTLINLLKQSTFVIGKTININKLNIQQRFFTIGDIQIPVSTSSMKFNLPLQKSSEREIYDFFDFSSSQSWFDNITWSIIN